VTRAVVFAYNEVGVRCLSVLLAHGVDVALVVTHEDSATENVFFSSVETLAAEHQIPTIKPASPNDESLLDRIQSLAPDFIFSFYYRHLISPQVLSLATRGALNMHGSLLPKYRGRAPTNWAVLHGESETGATLHYMVEKPDAGDIVDQMAVPILPNDSAHDVFTKVTVAAEIVLHRSLPFLIAGTAKRTALVPIPGQYFSGRKPEDGRIDCAAGTKAVHDLVRAVAPPYPGAFIDTAAGRFFVYKTRIAANRSALRNHSTLAREGDQLILSLADGGALTILTSQIENRSAFDALLPITL
jgi:methionyl-tRNA formyltransferase